MTLKVTRYVALKLVIITTLMSLTAITNGQSPVKEKKSRLVVSFYSICCGIDHQAKAKFDEFINSYEKSKRKQLAKSVVHWGKEGEIDYCLKLSELSSRDRKSFISKVRSLLKSSKLVHINENAVCQNGR